MSFTLGLLTNDDARGQPGFARAKREEEKKGRDMRVLCQGLWRNLLEAFGLLKERGERKRTQRHRSQAELKLSGKRAVRDLWRQKKEGGGGGEEGKGKSQ